MQIHVVQRGETLWSISQRYHVSLTQMIEINELPNPNELAVGQALLIPTNEQIHTVQPGEALWMIAQKYGTTVAEIVRINQITNPNQIYPGTKLLIPARRHVVKSGEALWQIARQYGVSVQAIVKENRIQNPNYIYPGMVLTIPSERKPTIEVNAYIFPNQANKQVIIQKIGKHLTYLSPFAYQIQPDGSINNLQEEEIISAALAQNVTPIMSVVNFSATDAGSKTAHTVLNNPELSEKLLNNLLNIMRTKGYIGINVDFEFVLPEDRDLYTEFLRRMVKLFHAEGFFVSTALAPKISADQKGLLYEAHDYKAHGEIVDFVVLMTYEWGYRLGAPRAISPVNEIRRVLDYAVSVIPREKIFMGFQIYARDWVTPHVKGQEAETFDVQEAISRAVRYGATIQYDERAQSPFYKYVDQEGRTHEVWFEDARSAQAKFDAVKDYGLRGISYWVLGYPFPQNWVLLEDTFNIVKR